MQSAFYVELTECGFVDKDVVELKTGKVGRISFRRNGWGNISYEFYFQTYTKKGVLSQMIHRIYDDVKLTEHFRLAEGEEIINAD